MTETPNLRWFEAFPNCRCGKKSEGILRGLANESYGHHCRKCAGQRLKNAAKARGEKP